MTSVKKQTLRSVVKLFDEAAANRLAELLADELISAEVSYASPLGFEIWVREDDFDRARAIWDATHVSEAELKFLASGALGEGGDTK